MQILIWTIGLVAIILLIYYFVILMGGDKQWHTQFWNI